MTPEQMEAEMKAVMEWMKCGKDVAWMLDPGSPLTAIGAAVQPDLTVTDGPFAGKIEGRKCANVSP